MNLVNLKQKDFYFLILLILFLTPLFLYGITDTENYNNEYFSAKYIFSDFKIIKFFSDYNTDFFGGITFPIGTSLYFYPLIFFINNVKIFYALNFIFCICLQYHFAKKILNFFNFRIELTHICILVFSIQNLGYIYINDHWQALISFSFFFPIFYFYLKIVEKKKTIYFYKLYFCLALSIINGSQAYNLAISMPLVIFFLFFRFNSKIIFNMNHFYSILLFLISISPIIYKILSELKFYDGENRNIQFNYSVKDFLHSQYLTTKKLLSDILHDSKIFFNSRLRDFSLGIIVWTSLSTSAIFIIKKKQTFHIFIWISLILSFIKWPYFSLSSYWVVRDIFVIFSLIYLSFTIKIIKILWLKKIFLGTVIIFQFIISVQCFKEVKKFSNYSFINNFNNQLDNSLEIIFKKEQPEYKRIFLSQNVFKDINDSKDTTFKKMGIHGTFDFYKYNLIPINIFLKNAHNEHFKASSQKFYQKIYFEDDIISNNEFLNFAKIKYLIFYKKDLDNIRSYNLTILKNIKINKKNILILKNPDFENLYIINNYKKDNCKEKELICKFDNLIIKKNKKISFKKNNFNEYEVRNFNNYNVNFLLPILSNKRIQILKNNKNINYKNIYNKFIMINTEPNSVYKIKIKLNPIFIFTKILMIISLLFFLLKIKKKF